MFLMIPDYTALDWNYVFNRGLDTIVGCIIALLVGLLFWPRGVYEELNQPTPTCDEPWAISCSATATG